MAGHHVDKVREVYAADWMAEMDEDQVAAARAAAEIVVDADAPETTCPACMTTFATGPAECPDCGLFLGG